MVSRRNYVTIAIMFLILFFMFQFTGVMKNQLNQYGVNEYEMNDQTDLGIHLMHLPSTLPHKKWHTSVRRVRMSATLCTGGVPTRSVRLQAMLLWKNVPT